LSMSHTDPRGPFRSDRRTRMSLRRMLNAPFRSRSRVEKVLRHSAADSRAQRLQCTRRSGVMVTTAAQMQHVLEVRYSSISMTRQPSMAIARAMTHCEAVACPWLLLEKVPSPSPWITNTGC